MSVLATNQGLVYFFKEWCVVELGCDKRIVGWSVEENRVTISDQIDYFDDEKNPTEAETSYGDRIVLVGSCRLTLDSMNLVNNYIKEESIEFAPRYYQVF